MKLQSYWNTFRKINQTGHFEKEEGEVFLRQIKKNKCKSHWHCGKSSTWHSQLWSLLQESGDCHQIVVSFLNSLIFYFFVPTQDSCKISRNWKKHPELSHGWMTGLRHPTRDHLNQAPVQTVWQNPSSEARSGESLIVWVKHSSASS